VLFSQQDHVQKVISESRDEKKRELRQKKRGAEREKDFMPTRDVDPRGHVS
jgi:hypothetical protein